MFREEKHALGRDVLDLSYRWPWDDRGIRSKTAEGRNLWAWNETSVFEPRVRWYHQTAADFYTHSLVAGDALADFATADSRLGEFDAWTGALKYIQRLPDGPARVLDRLLRADRGRKVGPGT